MSRYLTAEAKARELSTWEQLRGALAGVEGVGVPDAEMIPWCEKLNALLGVCTLQSCAGHICGERGKSGHLWLWLDEAQARVFHSRGFELAERSGIERVSLIYQPWGQEIAEIIFQGEPSGQLDSSMGAILGFLESL